MSPASKKSYGPIVQKRAETLLKTILVIAVAGDRDRGLQFNADWQEEQPPTLTIKTTLRQLTQLTYPDLPAHSAEFKKAKAQLGEALADLRDFVGILTDHRIQKKGSDQWHFSLRLWGTGVEQNGRELDALWEERRSPKSPSKSVPDRAPDRLPDRAPDSVLDRGPAAGEGVAKPKLKRGAPMPGVRLPENFVPRPDALAAVKGRLLAADGRTLVVSAIAGLGGLGKSVLATEIVLDEDIQGRFEDGILWVTLGQNPDLLGLVGDWIRVLDRSRESWSATTLAGAKGYLQSLLVERRMLLVIDDVWNAAHAEWFRVGGVSGVGNDAGGAA
jgi:hypothetical protein